MFNELSCNELEECNGGGVWTIVAIILGVGASLTSTSYSAGYSDGTIAAYRDGYANPYGGQH